MEALDFLEALFGILGILFGVLAVGHVFFGLALPLFTVATLMYALWFLVAINLGLFLYEEVRDVIYI
jgi:predicted RND superfamily exporter protein